MPAQEEATSTVDKESDLYKPLITLLEMQAKEDGVEAIVCPTHSLRARGRWQNPDVTHLAIERYPHLRQTRIVVTTYEVKQFPRWNVDAVYEAASHRRFAHRSYIVLEWPKNIEFSLTDPTYRLDQIFRECQRFDVGLATLHRHYNSYRFRERYEARQTPPKDEDIESWLEHVFERDEHALQAYNGRIRALETSFGKDPGD